MAEQPYYDKNYLEIQKDDLLKVYHFTSNKKKYYMYKIAVLNDNGLFEYKEYHKDGNNGHCRLLSCADKETRVIRNAEIIYKPDWHNEPKLKREARKRKKEIYGTT